MDLQTIPEATTFEGHKHSYIHFCRPSDSICTSVRHKFGWTCHALNRRRTTELVRCKNTASFLRWFSNIIHLSILLQFFKNIPVQDEYLKHIPAYEAALTQVLRGIKISRRKFMPKAQAAHYAAYLRKVTTSMLDYLTQHSNYPESWPTDLSNFEIVIESYVLH